MQPYYKKIRKYIRHDLLMLPSVAARIINSDNKILLVRKRNSSIWGFPAGSVEPWETAEEAIKREVFEEINAHIKVQKLIGIYTSPEFDYVYPNGDKVHPFILFFDCIFLDKSFVFVPNSEIEEVRYFTEKDLPEMLKCCSAKAKDAFVNSSTIFMR